MLTQGTTIVFFDQSKLLEILQGGDSTSNIENHRGVWKCSDRETTKIFYKSPEWLQGQEGHLNVERSRRRLWGRLIDLIVEF